MNLEQTYHGPADALRLGQREVGTLRNMQVTLEYTSNAKIAGFLSKGKEV